MAQEHHIQRDSRLWGLPEWVTTAHLDALPKAPHTLASRHDADGEYLLVEYGDGTEKKIRPGDPIGPVPEPEPFTPEPGVLDEVSDLEDTPVDHSTPSQAP